MKKKNSYFENFLSAGILHELNFYQLKQYGITQFNETLNGEFGLEMFNIE